MKHTVKILTVLALLALLAAQTACTANQVDDVISDLQIGVDAASIAAPLVLAAFAPGVAAPVNAYLALANQVFAEIAKIVASQASNSQKGVSIASAIASLVSQDPTKFLPTNASPQLVAELTAVANAARAVAALFPSTAAGKAHLAKAASTKLKLSAAQTKRLAAIQVQAQAQANQAALAARR
jgi:hypothetical protein